MTLTTMDTSCVPSPNLINSTFSPSPHSISIYEQDRLGLFSGDSKMSMNNTIEIQCGSYEENHPLDDHFEDSSLKITPELLSSMTNTSVATGFGLQSSNIWGNNKLNLSDSQGIISIDQSFPLGMDSDYLSDLLNIDSNDSKFSLPNFDFDFITSNSSSTCQTPIPSLSESKADFQEVRNNKDVIFSSSSLTSDNNNIEQDFKPKRVGFKLHQFPPRKSEPPVCAVPPVIIKEEIESYPNMQGHWLLTKSMNVKQEDGNRFNSFLTELPPQTVPSVKFPEHIGCDTVKMESPDSSRKRVFTMEDEMKPLDLPPTGQSKRRRYDSGSSWHTSEDGDEYNDNLHNDYDSDDDNSDLDADLAHIEPGNCESLIDTGKKQKQYFWQYNVQAKGPKGTRLKLSVESSTDPHVLSGFEDPVFDEGNTIVAGIRHGGKARKGDGNEVTPNPLKLFKIGHQLLRLSKKINACQLGSDVPVVQRNEARREKNKLASRACRLKKKAQHEANKIKLHGMEMEHGEINNVLRNIWPTLREKAKLLQQNVNPKTDPDNSLTNKLTSLISSNLKNRVALNTTEFVNNVIMTVEKKDLSGGLNIRSRKT